MIEADLDAVAGEVINVATGRDASVSEIADLVLELCGKPASLKEHVEERPGQVARHIGSTESGAAARLDRADVAGRGPEPYRRLVSRERVLGRLVPCGSGRRRAHDLSSEPSAQRSRRSRRPR